MMRKITDGHVDADSRNMHMDKDYITQKMILWTICATISEADYRWQKKHAWGMKARVGLSVKATSLRTGQVGKLHDNGR